MAFLWNFRDLKQLFKIYKKTRIRFIFENMGKLLTEHVWKEPRNRILFKLCCLVLNRVVGEIW